ncbi:alpha/beta fold hydrolase [Streptomyces sp. NPDC016469]|uniref:alpha/beta hydrolase n=1 Tax=Streptomyces sp. NPDC016469 TaxID=3157191 RepID=UPI0033DB0177
MTGTRPRTGLLAGLGYPVRLFRRFHRPVSAPDFERPEDYGLTAEPFGVVTRDGVTIRGWTFTPESPWGVVILCHARSASKSRVLRQAELLHRRGLTVVTFDFRGCGESDTARRIGGNRLQSPLRDLEAVSARVAELHGADPVLGGRVALMGCSFGGNMVIAHAGTAGVHYPALVLDSTPLVRWADMLRELLRSERRGSPSPRLRAVADRAVVRAVVLSTRADVLYRLARRSAGNLARTPLLLIVGERDTLFDVEEGCRFLDRYYAGPREVWRVGRGRHLTNHVVDSDVYGERIVSFLRATFP